LAIWTGAWLPAAAAAQGQAPLTAFSAGEAQVMVSRQGEDYLRFNVIAWGPQWSWTGLEGQPKGEQGATVGEFTGKMGGTGVPFRVGFRAARTAPQRLQFDYEIRADSNTDLTYVVIELAPGKTFNGRDVVVTSQGKDTPVRCPFERRGLGRDVAASPLGRDGSMVSLGLSIERCWIGLDLGRAGPGNAREFRLPPLHRVRDGCKRRDAQRAAGPARPPAANPRQPQ
jgi:hypothetical protein